MPTIVYESPVTGTTPPTLAQAFNCNSVAATIVFADADTTTLVTHNFALTTAQLAELQPWPLLYPAAVGTATAAVVLTIALTNSLAVTVNKSITSAGSGVGWTWNLIIQRPFSAIT